MGYHYIVLINEDRRGTERSSAIETALREAGVQHRLTIGCVELFTARDTPTLILADGGFIIGYLFSRTGVRATNSSRIPTFSCHAKLRDYLLANYWGEYLLFQPVTADGTGLTITREPSGGVPCVYSSLRNGSAFAASDISLATRINRYRKRIDWDYVTRSLTYPHQKTTRTGLADVNELLPGCTVRLVGAHSAVEQNWSPWDFVSRDHRYTDAREAAADVRQTVASAVRAWANADRSILLEISGGLDSSIVAACLRDTQARVVCCTLVTPVPGADERQYARLVAKQLGVELQTAMLDFEDARFSFVPNSSTVSPRVTALHYAIDNVISAVGNQHDTAAYFTGAGGDTVFSYLTNAAPAADAFKELGLAGGVSAIRHLSALHQCTLWTAARLTLRKLAHVPKAPRTPHRTFVDPTRVADAPEDHPWFDAPAEALPGDRERVFGLVDTLVYREMGPRGTVRWLRMPLLAQPVVEACLKTPSWMCIADGKNRAIARAAFADTLPVDILNRRSKGNFVGYLGGFYRRNKAGMRDFLLSGQLSERRLLNNKVLNDFFNLGDLPTRDSLFLELFDLCMIENWLRHQH